MAEGADDQTHQRCFIVGRTGIASMVIPFGCFGSLEVEIGGRATTVGDLPTGGETGSATPIGNEEVKSVTGRR